MTLRDSQAWFEHLKLRGAKGEIADKVVREIGATACASSTTSA
jgi:excinuclease ABC subunit A